MSEWEEIYLGDIIQIKHGWAFKGEYFAEDGDVIVLTPGNFFEEGGFRLRENKEKFYTNEYPIEYMLQKDDLIIAMTEQGAGLLGSPALIPENNKFLHNQRLGLFHKYDNEKIVKKYLYYLFFTKNIRGLIAGSATGTKVKHTAPKRIYDIKIKLPPLNTQKKIAKILSNYDDLIENNLKQIKLLEEKARLTYEEWFLRFKVDGVALEIDEVSGLPFGWERIPLSETGEFLNGYAFKPKDLLIEGLPIIKIKEMKNGIIKDTPRNHGHNIDNKYLVRRGDIIFSWSATLEVIQWRYEQGLLNQHLFKVTPKDEFSKSLLYLILKDSLNIFDTLTTGSTMKHIRRTELDFVKIIKPNKIYMQKFDSKVKPILNQIINLSTQNQNLKEARDILLPRLMSGLIEV